MTHKPTFADFYLACNGHPPFPWQDRLARMVAESDTWPAEIGVPTGLGKTACLDIAVWWLATQADREPAERSAPTRIWWVVNRRLLVDSTADHAMCIAKYLENPQSQENLLDVFQVHALTWVRRQLERISASDTRILDVIRLRGGVASRTVRDPAQPTIILCTLPMYGSRLLFRGYGSRSRSVDAAMAGTDSLVLLDEAHLASHLRNLIPSANECMPGEVQVLGDRRSRPQLVELTATGMARPDQRFDLDSADLKHDEVRARMNARKPLDIVECKGVRLGRGSKDHDYLEKEREETGRRLAEACTDLLDGRSPSFVLVFANTPATARNAFERIRERWEGEGKVVLLTGRQREREAALLRSQILPERKGMAPPDVPRERHLIVVATQTLEVGADLDAEFMVTEACGVRALTQRLGRLNRLGRHEHARGVYIHLPPRKKVKASSGKGKVPSWPVYDVEPLHVLERLQDAKGRRTGAVDMSPARVRDVLGDPNDHAGFAPEVTQGILWEWLKTTTPPKREAPVDPYFSGIQGADYTVSLIWRAYVPDPHGETPRLWPRATDSEALEIPLREAREVLVEAEVESVCRLTPDNLEVEHAMTRDLRPGDRIVLTTDRGLMDEFGWNPEASKPVVDVSLPGWGLPLDAQAIRHLCGVDGLERHIQALHAEGSGQEDVDLAVSSLLDALRGSDAPFGWGEPLWQDFLDSLKPVPKRAHRSVLFLQADDSSKRTPWVSDDLDETSLSTEAIGLDAHCRAVAKLAGRIAERVGFSPALARAVEVAGRYHDIGKADIRFQRWLQPDFEPDFEHAVLKAKSDTSRQHLWEKTRKESGWPRGGRHEVLSARLVQGSLAQCDPPLGQNERDLIIHLIASHHKKARPFTIPIRDGTPLQVSARVGGVRVTVPANLAQADWEQPTRFYLLNEWLGPWGLSLMEAIVTLADHQVSGRGE